MIAAAAASSFFFRCRQSRSSTARRLSASTARQPLVAADDRHARTRAPSAAMNAATPAFRSVGDPSSRAGNPTTIAARPSSSDASRVTSCRHAIDGIGRARDRQRPERTRQRSGWIADRQTDAAPPDVDPEDTHRSMLQFVVTRHSCENLARRSLWLTSLSSPLAVTASPCSRAGRPRPHRSARRAGGRASAGAASGSRSARGAGTDAARRFAQAGARAADQDRGASRSWIPTPPRSSAS